METPLKVFSGSSNPGLVQMICDLLEVSQGKAMIRTFSDGEIRVEIEENVRGADAFVVQSGAYPVNDNLMELLVLIDALKRASARRITAVVPYYPYGRQDRKNKPRVPITARLVADMIAAAGAHRVLTMDLHAGQIQGFFNIPVDNLYASPVILPYIRNNFNSNLTIVSPDAGGVPRARAYARRLNAGLVLIDKRRADANTAEAMHIIGDVEGKVVIILDDMVDTAGTLIEGCKALLGKGAKEVYACVTHPVLSGPAVERIENSPLKKLIVSDTMPLRDAAKECQKITCVTSSNLFADAIKNIHDDASISRLFEILH
jgi:ribose-phosphate pyrophosphokinase